MRAVLLRRWVALMLAVMALSAGAELGCAGPTLTVEHYAGPRRAPETIAILRFYGNDQALLVMIDGERADVRLEEDVRLHVEVLPGKHQVGVVPRDDVQGPLRLAFFEAQAGKVYRVSVAHDPAMGGTGRARVHEVDAESDAPIRDVTLRGTHDEGPSRLPPSLPPPSFGPQ